MLRIKMEGCNVEVDSQLNMLSKADCLNECVTDCLKKLDYNMYSLQFIKQPLESKSLKKSLYYCIPLNHIQYIIYNEKYQILVDQDIYDVLNFFTLDYIYTHEEIVTVLYNLGFLVDA